MLASPPPTTWEPLPADFILPDEPGENIQQPLLAHALTDALSAAGWLQPQMLIATNMGLVASVGGKILIKAPDWFYVPHIHPVTEGLIRRSYTPYLEGEKVAVVMEFLSDTDGGELSIRSTPPYGKLHFYEQILKVPVYITYDPYVYNLEMRYLHGEHYLQQTPNEQGRFWLPEMNLFLGLWWGEHLGQEMTWLRWWDEQGNLLLWNAEKAELEHQRAERYAAKLRELGLDPEQV